MKAVGGGGCWWMVQDRKVSSFETLTAHLIYHFCVSHSHLTTFFNHGKQCIMMSACACETGGGVDDAAKDNNNRYH